MSTEQGNGTTVVPETVPGQRLPAPGGAIVSRIAGPPPAEPVDAGLLLDEPTGAPAPDADAAAAPAARRRRLRAGCYLLRYTPTASATAALPIHYDGTLRVERDATNTIASGDLYLHRRKLPQPFLPPKEPNPAAGIPIFPIGDYRYYVRVTTILEGAALATQFTLGFELHRFDHATDTWSNAGAFKATMKWMTAPAGYPSATNFLRGTVRDAAGANVGVLTMGWVSKYLRRATIEVDRVPDSEPALTNAAGLGWREIFGQVGWDVTVDESDVNLLAPSGASWSDAEMHAAMLARRDSADLDREWRYWLVCVRLLDSTSRGIMFDAFAGDSNNIPREGAGQASHWTIPDESPWGLVKGMRFGLAQDPYFRTGVHELGHAMGLYHNTVDNGFMNTTDVIASSAVPPQQFPQNVQWSHAQDDQQRLRHMPDLWVRPGGVSFGADYGTAPIAADDGALEIDGLELGVRALLTTVPIGAPVRVDIALRNAEAAPVPVPADLSLKGGHVQGAVTDPSGTTRAFRSLVRCVEEHRVADLEPGGERAASLTLLRGPDGALFPAAGPYTIRVEATWELEGMPLRIAGAGTVMITSPVDDAHAEAALHVLGTPDALLTLALGGDHLADGVAAIGAAVENDVLRPHFAFVEARRVATPFQGRPADLERAAALLDETTVMSAAEVGKASRLVAAAAGRGAAAPGPLVDVLRAKAAETGAGEAERTLDAL